MTTIRLLTKTQLKAECLKTAPGQQPAARFWQGMGWVYQHDASADRDADRWAAACRHLAVRRLRPTH